jgi:hypothetical protein
MTLPQSKAPGHHRPSWLACFKTSDLTRVRSAAPVGTSLDLAPASLAFEGLQFVCVAEERMRRAPGDVHGLPFADHANRPVAHAKMPSQRYGHVAPATPSPNQGLNESLTYFCPMPGLVSNIAHLSTGCSRTSARTAPGSVPNNLCAPPSAAGGRGCTPPDVGATSQRRL